VLIALKGLFSLLNKEKMKALGSACHPDDESHAFSVNPPKMFPFVDLMTVKVLEIPSHLR
jgi:hypothetical protein